MTASWDSPAAQQAVEDRYRAFLGHWPVPSERLRVPTREGETFIVACGPPEAPPAVLLHGAGANTVMWMGDAAAWSSARRVYAVDVIGEPGLSAPSRPPLTSGAYADYTLLIQQHYRPRRDRLPVFTDDQLRNLTMPLLAITGARDGLLDSRQTSRRLFRRLLPQAAVTLLPDSGHLLLGQTQRIREFLSAEPCP